MKNCLLAAAFLCLSAVLFPHGLFAQESPDHQAIRALLTADQEAWINGDGEGVLAIRDENYFSAHVPRNNGVADFGGVKIGGSYEDIKEKVLDPEWRGNPGAEVLADTTLDFKARHEMVRIDVEENHAVAVSRIEWSQNDTTKNVRIRGGWESLWFLRKIGGEWKFTSAVGGISS